MLLLLERRMYGLHVLNAPAWLLRRKAQSVVEDVIMCLGPPIILLELRYQYHIVVIRDPGRLEDPISLAM